MYVTLSGRVNFTENVARAVRLESRIEESGLVQVLAQLHSGILFTISIAACGIAYNNIFAQF